MRDICCKSPPYPWRSPGVCTYTHACANVHTPYTVHWRDVPNAVRLLAANGSRAGAAAKETSVSSGAQSQEAPLKSKQSTRAPAWQPPVELGAQAGPSITPEGRAGGCLGGRPRQGETGGFEEGGWWERDQDRPGASCQRRSSRFCRLDSCHAETASGLTASRARRLRMVMVSAGNPQPVCGAGWECTRACRRAGMHSGRAGCLRLLSPQPSLSPSGRTNREKGPNLPAPEETGGSLVEHGCAVTLSCIPIKQILNC